jgi:HD-GYP domain-containing protein (c-di-GMP phosphodiesterase class II)
VIPDELVTMMAARLIDEMARRDPLTHAHSERVARLSTGIGAELHLSMAELEDLRVAAMLHDIGKIAVSGTLLSKTERLSIREFARVKSHSEMGYELLSNVPGLERYAGVARWHHERWDGTGYPDRKRMEDTPLHSRIVALADSVDVMLNGRHYQSARDPREVILEVRRSAGSHFDPAVVNALMSAWMGGLLPGFD